MTKEEEDFSALIIDSPSSHVALSGDLTVFITKSDQALGNENYARESDEENDDDVKQLEGFPNESPLLR